MSTHDHPTTQPAHSRRDFMKRMAFVSAAAAGAATFVAGAGAVLTRPVTANAAEAASQAGEGPVALPPLPYPMDALEPVISYTTMTFHYGKHHAGYATKAAKQIAGTEMAAMSLPELVEHTAADPSLEPIFNNVAQVWNHTFFWNSLSPNGGGAPAGDLLTKIESDFGGVDACKQAIAKAALSRFASGWAWLVVNKDGKLEAVNTMNADVPFTQGMKPLLTIDVWEHAYYLDYQNRRGEFVNAVLDKLVNWDFAAQNFAA